VDITKLARFPGRHSCVVIASERGGLFPAALRAAFRAITLIFIETPDVMANRLRPVSGRRIKGREGDVVAEVFCANYLGH